jgi:hypothetical protein
MSDEKIYVNEMSDEDSEFLFTSFASAFDPAHDPIV